jgi:hypothetical protein
VSECGEKPEVVETPTPVPAKSNRLVTLYFDEWEGMSLDFAVAFALVSAPPPPGTTRWKIEADLEMGVITLRKAT